MTTQTISSDLRTFIADNFLFQEYLGSDDDSFLESGILDSTGILELIYFLESSYGIVVEDDEMIPENLDTISNIAYFVQKKSKES